VSKKKKLTFTFFILCVYIFNHLSFFSLCASWHRAYCDKLSAGKTRILYTNVENYHPIAVTALDSTKWDNLDGINNDNEAVRIAASSGAKALQSLVSHQ
jgi:hypothetical protein